MRKILVALVVCPLVAFAQGPGPGAGGGGGNGHGKGAMPDPARMEKRMRLARTLGLAEALDLDTAQALRLGDTLERFDERRRAAHRQMKDAREALRRAASGEKVAAAEVDQAIQKLFDARAQLQASDREMVSTIVKDLTPEKRARAALFLGRFEERIERRVRFHGPGPGRGPEGRTGMVNPPGMPGERRTMLFRGGPGGGPGPEDDDRVEACLDAGCPGPPGEYEE